MMKKKEKFVDWSTLPNKLLGLIAVQLFSVVELLRFRSICKNWRSSVSISGNNHFPNHPLISLNPLVITITNRNGKEQIHGLDRPALLSRASFFRVTLSSSSSSSSKGWLIKYNSDQNYGSFRLLNPLSRLPLGHFCKSVDMLKYSFFEIQSTYIVQNRSLKEESFGFKRLVLERNHQILGVGCDGKIRFEIR